MGWLSFGGDDGLFGSESNSFTNIFDPLDFFGTNVKRDKDIGASISVAKDIAQDQLKFGREQFDFNKARAEKFDPKYLEALDLQSSIARDARDRSADQNARYLKTFAPIEERMAKDALEYDSPEAIERAAQEASAGVSKGFGVARDTRRRDMQRMGVNPASGAYMGAADELGIAEAGTRAGAENMAREGRRAGGIALRGSAANFGRGFPATSMNSDQLALGAAAGTTGTTNAAITTPGSAMNLAAPWYSGAAATNYGMGNLAAEQFAIREGTETKRRGQALDFGGSMMGMFGGGMAMSSEKVKEDKEPVNAELILDGLENIPVEAWKYKKGVADGGKHVGPYAEDVQREFGDGAAPGGEMLDMVSMNGILLAGVKELAKKVKKLEGGDGMHMVSTKRRPTEPRRSA